MVNETNNAHLGLSEVSCYLKITLCEDKMAQLLNVWKNLILRMSANTHFVL